MECGDLRTDGGGVSWMGYIILSIESLNSIATQMDKHEVMEPVVPRIFVSVSVDVEPLRRCKQRFFNVDRRN